MNEFQNQMQRLTDWWYELNYSNLQKRALLILGGLLLGVSILWISVGKSEPIPEAIPIRVQAPLVTVELLAGAVQATVGPSAALAD